MLHEHNKRTDKTTMSCFFIQIRKERVTLNQISSAPINKGGVRKWKDMGTTVKVSLGPHRQTKDIQHLSCLSTRGCKSRKLAAHVVQRCANHTEEIKIPLATKWEKEERKRECWMTSSCLISICSSPHFSLTKRKYQINHLVYQRTEKRSVSHIQPRPVVQVVVW